MDKDEATLNEIQVKVNSVCGNYNLQGEVVLTEDGQVWVILSGDMTSKTEQELREIGRAIETIEGVDRVSWSV